MALENTKITDDFIQLARTAMAGRPQDIQLLIHRASKKYKDDFPEMTNELLALLKESPSRSAPLRKHFDIPLPVDIDSRLQLLRVEAGQPEYAPILSQTNQGYLDQVLSERKNSNALFKLGLHPTKSMLFNGPPGVGKTLAAKWIAFELKRPLLILDLAAVMSSYLGRTGNNIRHVLDYAKNMECVLLLDELDAIAKRRDDNSEIGELKRLVTVLLQEIDDWPPTGLLIAATNHPDLLDPAIWRRFEVVLEFGRPLVSQIEHQVRRLINGQVEEPELWSKVLSYVLIGKSYSEIEREINLLRKSSAISGAPLAESIKAMIVRNDNLSKDQLTELAVILEEKGIISQRKAYELTGISRDTIRKYRHDSEDKASAKSTGKRVIGADKISGKKRTAIKSKTNVKQKT